MVFTGTYEHTIDAKNRLAIPAEVRAQILAERGKGAAKGPVYLYVTPGEGQSLCLYTVEGFEKRAADLDQSTLDPELLLEYERLLYSHASRVEMDAQGRIRLPDLLLKMAGLAGEVVLLGVKDHLEIRDREAWRTYAEQVRAARPQLFMNPRRALSQLGQSRTGGLGT